LGSAFPCVCPSSRGWEGRMEMYLFTLSYNTKQA
jgi:hypothetical protein